MGFSFILIFFYEILVIDHFYLLVRSEQVRLIRGMKKKKKERERGELTSASELKNDDFRKETWPPVGPRFPPFYTNVDQRRANCQVGRHENPRKPSFHSSGAALARAVK